MNIFEVLNSGKSRLYEPSLSSVLGYFLDSKENHGLGDTFIRLFLQLINIISNNSVFHKEIIDNRIISDVSLEEPYKLGQSRKDRYIDVQISLLNNENDEIYRIIIENKIKPSSASLKQLSEYYKAITENETSLDNLLIIFLTPFSNNIQLEREYENLVIPNNSRNHNKCWIFWNNHNNALINLFKSLLEKELKAEINPINEYLRHTLKAFIKFASELTESNRTIRFGKDIGDIVEKKDIEIDREIYTIIRRNSQQIQVTKNGEKVIAKEILRKIINKYNLDISDDDTYSLTTRQLGKSILEKLNMQSKE